MIDINQNINFKAKIIPSQGLYSKRAPMSSSVPVPWTLMEAKFSKDECATGGIISCTSGFLKPADGDEFFMFHLNPHNPRNYWGDVKEAFSGVIERFKFAGKKSVEGFLVGATFADDTSRDFAYRMVELFRDSGVNFSALLGQKCIPKINLHYSLPKNEATVGFRDCETVSDIWDLHDHFSKVILGTDEFLFRREYDK